MAAEPWAEEARAALVESPPARPDAGVQRQPARQSSLRRHNLALVLAELSGGARRSRAQVAVRTGLTKATVSSLVDGLLDAGLVVEEAPERGAVGRPASPLSLNRRGPAGLGIEVNVDYVAASVVDLTGEIRAHESAGGDNRSVAPEHALRRAAAMARRVERAASRGGLAVAGVGVALPGIVDADGRLRVAPNLPGWRNFPVVEHLGGLLGRELPPTAAGNEANLAAMAELWYGGRPGLRDFVYVSGEIGIGAGIVVEGRLFRGVRRSAGELGHVMVDAAGPRCGCGAYGCVEQFAGQEALLRAAGVAAEAGSALANPTGAVAELLGRARDGDARTLEALRRAGTALGIAVSAVVNLVDVPTVVLGGLHAQLAPYVASAVARELSDRVVGAESSPVRLEVSSLGPGAAVRGAAASVVREILEDPGTWLPGILVGA
ncbi:MAG TPA: ROK family transcriptional regulator [Acidimicrobiales bacterium]|nr:ROK family transcriptional regulator [Acidimicrobiales bacterium]